MALSFNKNFRLAKSQYRNEKMIKSGICVHHTVGGSAESTFHWWNGNPATVGTAYIIDKDGAVLEVFDPESWAWQFGLKNWSDADRFAFERRFIGIELASEGGLVERDGICYCFDRITPRTKKSKDEVFDAGRDYRGTRYFDKYEPSQIESLVELINDLCERFNISRKMLPDPLEYYGQEIKDFKGVIGHVNVRKDKTDPAPMPELWEKLKTKCDLTIEEILSSVTDEDEKIKMSEREVNELFEHNFKELNKMYVPAGSMVKSLIMELERKNRDTYIKLRDAEPGGHAIFYNFVEGDRELVEKLAQALGFKKATSNKLVVHDA